MYWTPGFPICIQLNSEKYLWTIYRKVLFKVSDVSSLDHVIIMANHWPKNNQSSFTKKWKKRTKSFNYAIMCFNETEMHCQDFKIWKIKLGILK